MKKMSLNVSLDGKDIELSDDVITDMFHHIYYGSRVWEHTYYFGRHILKCPLDMWVYQEIFHEIKPDYLIETGTFHGGSALYYAHLFDLIGNGEIITIDVNHRDDFPEHKRIAYVNASSTDVDQYAAICKKIGTQKKVLVVLDADHSMDHVYSEMKLWSNAVSLGSYLIVEDSNVNGHPVRPDFGPGPMEAIERFLEEDDRFVIDLSREKFRLTQNPKGYLKRIK